MNGGKTYIIASGSKLIVVIKQGKILLQVSPDDQ